MKITDIHILHLNNLDGEVTCVGNFTCKKKENLLEIGMRGNTYGTAFNHGEESGSDANRRIQYH